MKNYNLIISLIIISLISFSCSSSQQGPKSGKKASSSKTGWHYNDKDFGGFEVNLKYKGFQAPVPGMAFIEGGTFMMGQTEENIMQDGSATRPRAVTVTSFWMDQTEVTNVDYREYTDWMKLVFANAGSGSTARSEEQYYVLYDRSLPDTTVWRSRYGYNEPMVENYFRHPAYNNYPVVGVSWEQAMAYCEWRTDRVNEKRLCDELGIDIEKYKEKKDGGGRDDPEDYFTTERYLKDPNFDLDHYKTDKERRKDEAAGKNPKRNLAWKVDGKEKDGHRKIRIEDGVFVPKFRLPTEAEWEYAALALIGNSHEDYVKENKIYPWNRHSVRDNVKSTQGQILANFKISQGDYMGYSGYHNDVGSLTTPVRSFMPNDFGLFDMAGNVAEWTLDVYRRETGKLDDVNPHRGNNWKDVIYRDVDGMIIDEPLKVADLDSADAVAFGYEWDSLNGSVQYGLNVSPNDFVKIPVDFKGDTWKMDPTISNEENTNYDELYDLANSPRRNYNSSNNAGDRDGQGDGGGLYQNGSFGEYSYGRSSLVNNYTRVYKGGGWKDDAYWLSPGARRYLNQDLSAEFIGFRCVLDHMGWESSKDQKRPRTKARVKRK